MTWTGCGLSYSATPRAIFFQTGRASCTAAVEPADGPMDVDQLQPSTPNEPPQVHSPHVRRRARSCQGLLVGRLMSRNRYHLHEEPLPVSGQVHAMPSRGDANPGSAVASTQPTAEPRRASRGLSSSATPRAIFNQSRRSCQPHIRHRALCPRGPLMGRWTSGNRCRLSPKSPRKCPARAIFLENRKTR
jgi:hypothetical protein